MHVVRWFRPVALLGRRRPLKYGCCPRFASAEDDHASILWTAETADNVYELATDTFVVHKGKIVAPSFAGKITPRG